MFGWFQPHCPLGTQEKVWVESRMSWLASALGGQRMLEARVIEPTDEFFPDHYDHTPAAVQRIFARLLTYMQVDSARVGVVVRDDWTDRDPLGQYHQGQPSSIELNPSQLQDPESLVGTLVHELAHEILLGGVLLTENNEDLERLTDLLPAFLGLGIFCANSAFREKTLREGRFSWWSVHKQGYLPMRMHAYGLALFAFAREETLPRWAEHLRLDIREPMFKGLRFLEKTDDTTLDISGARRCDELRPLDDCVEHLGHKSPSFRLLALSCLAEHGPAAALAVEAVARLLHDRDPDIPIAAAHALASIGPDAAACIPELQSMLASRIDFQREHAAYALGAIGTNDAGVLDDLVGRLDDQDREVAGAAAFALGRCVPGNEQVARRLLPAFEEALCKCDYPRISLIAAALHATSADPRALVHEHIQHLGADIAEFADDSLNEAAGETKSAEGDAE